jgi:hypothetical protein
MPWLSAVVPQAIIPAVRALCSRGEVVRVSWAVRIVLALEYVARACPIRRASWEVMVVPVLPLMPLVPKSLFKGNLSGFLRAWGSDTS